jgi:hypothetical protein
VAKNFARLLGGDLKNEGKIRPAMHCIAATGEGLNMDFAIRNPNSAIVPGRSAIIRQICIRPRSIPIP